MEFVSYEIAKKLKEKGFYYECVATYDNDGILGYNYIQPTNIRAIGFDDCLCSHNVENDNCIDAPTISQVLKWLREEKRWVIVVRLYSTNGWYWFIQDEKGELKSSHLASCDDCFATYELATIAGVNYCLENLI